MTISTVGFDAAEGGAFHAGTGEAFEGRTPTTAATLIGVQSLDQPELLAEI